MPTIKNQAGKILIFFLAAVTLFAGCAPPGPRALLRGKKFLEQGEYPEAIENLKAATVLLGGTNAQAFNYLGVACHRAGQTTEAQKAYQKALALNPDLAEARYNLGCLALDEGKFEQAKSELTTYTLRRPNAADGWLKLGLAQLRLSQSAPSHLRPGQVAAADKSFAEALRLNPQEPEALTGLGLVRLQRGQPREAKQFFARALQEKRDYRPALLNLAIVEQQYLGERQLALESYRAYLALKPAPEDSDAVGALARQLEKELAPAPPPMAAAPTTPVCSNAVSVKPIPAETARTSTSPKVTRRDVARTTAPARSEPLPIVSRFAPAPTSSAAPASTTPATNVEVVHLEPEPVLMAARDVPATVGPAPTSKTQPVDAAAPPTQTATDSRFPRYHYRSPAKPASGNRPEAERAFAEGVQSHQAQRLPEAIGSYRRALRLDPSFYDACYNLALAATQTGNVALALSTYENALAIRPESSDARYNFALVLMQANYCTDAANEMERVIAAYPNDSRAHLALGNLYAQQLREYAKARSHYLKALEIDPRNPQAAAVRAWLTGQGR